MRRVSRARPESTLVPAMLSIPMLGRIDNFWIVIAIVIGSMIWEWFKRKGQTPETDSRPADPHGE